MPHFSTAAPETNTGLGAVSATQLCPGAPQTAPFLHFQAHKWHQPKAGDLPAGAAAAPVRVWWCWWVLVAQEPPVLLGPRGVPEQGTPHY